MKNGDMPAMPLVNEAGFPGHPDAILDLQKSGVQQCSGLTKREFFAAMAMQGLLAGDVKSSREGFVKESVDMAYMLLKELEKRQ